MSSRTDGTVVDSKVVEMSFDNSNFESNTKESISTLGKLKEALNFTNSTKGLDEINSDIGRIKIGPLTESVRGLRGAFDSLGDTIGFAMIQRYTNQALDSIERLTKSLTFDQISAGWQKYGDKTTSVGTLVAQGYDLDTVNAQLEKLNWFTDETSYNFVDMTSNIAKFTATGQSLEDSVTAMEGIANWAALSGQNAQKASMAMYQLSQAMGAGVMRKEDYKSIQNVSMDTQEFRQHAIDAAIALGTLEKVGEDTYRSLVADSKAGAEAFNINQFAESLTQGAWFTKDVMMDVFKDYSSAVDQIYEYAEEHGITASEAIREAGDQFDAFGVKAFAAAQEARTFGDVIDSVKDAVSTQFMNMFEIIFGDYEQAKTLWTSMSETLYNVFAQPIADFNELLEEAFGSSSPQAEAVENMQEVVTTLDDLHKMAAEVIKGDWGNEGDDPLTDRMNRLSEAGYDAQKIQDYVNKIHELTNGTWEYDEALLAEIDGYSEVEKAAADAGMKASEYLKTITDPRPTGRELMLDSMKKSFKGLSIMFGAIQKGFNAVFNPLTAEHIYNFVKGIDELAKGFKNFVKDNKTNITNIFKGLFSILDLGIRTVKTFVGGSLKALSSALKASGINVLELAGNVGKLIFRFRNWIVENETLQKGFALLADGISLAIQSVGTFFSTLKDTPIIKKFSGYFSDFTSKLSNSRWVTRFREAFKEADGSLVRFFTDITTNADGSTNMLGSFFGIFKTAFDFIVDSVKKAYEVTSEFFKSLKVGELVSNTFRDFKMSIGDFFSNLPEKFSKLGKSFSEFIAKVKELGGIKLNNLGEIWKSFKNTVGSFVLSNDFFGGILEAFSNLRSNIGERLSAIGIDVEGIKTKIVKTFNDLKTAIANFNLGDIFKKIKEFFTGSKDVDNPITDIAKSLEEGGKVVEKSSGILDVISGIFDGIKNAFTAFVEGIGSLLPSYDQIIAAIAGLGILVGGLNIRKALSLVSDITGAFDKKLNAEAIRDQALAIGIIAASIAGLAYTFNQSPQAFGAAAGAVAGIMVAVVAFSAALKKIDEEGELIQNVGEGIKNIADSIAVLAAVVAALSLLPVGNYLSGVAKLIGLMVLLGALVFAINVISPATFTLTGVNILALTGSMVLLAGLMAVLSKINLSALWKGLLGLIPVFIALGAVALTANLVVRQGDIGTALTILALAGAVVLIAGAMAVIGLIPKENLRKAEEALLVIAGVISAMLAVSYLAKDSAPALFAIGVTVALLTGAIVALSIIPEEALHKAINTLGEVMAVFTIFMSVLLLASHFAGGSAGIFLGIAATMIAMTASIYILSTIEKSKLRKAEEAITIMGAVMAGLMIASQFATGSLIGIIAMGVALAAVAGVLFLLTNFTDVDKLKDVATSLSETLAALGLVMIAITNAGLFAPAAITGALLMVGFLTTFALVALAINKLTSGDPSELIAKIKNGSELIKAIAETMGEVLGAFIGGAMSQVASYLPQISESVGQFFTTMNDISQNAGDVDLSPISKACDALAKVSLSSLVSSIVGWFTPDDLSAVEMFSQNLQGLGEAMKTWSENFNALGSINIDVEGVNNLVTAVNSVTVGDFSTLFKKFLFEDVTRDSIESFKSDVTALGEALSTWAESFNTIGKIKIDVEGVTNLTDSLAEVQTKSGGLFGIIGGFFAGAPDFEKFKTQIVQLGSALTAFGNEIDGADTKKINSASKAINALAELGEKISKLDLGGMFGEGDIVKFGSQITQLTQELKKLVDETVDTESIKAMGEDLSAAIAAYSEISLKGDISNNSLVKSFKANITSLKDILKGEVSTKGADSLKKAIETLTSTSFKDSSEVIDSASNLGENIVKKIADGVKSKKDSVSAQLKSAINIALNALKSFEAKFKAEGETFTRKLAEGIKSVSSEVKNAANKVAESGTSGLKNYRSQFESAGKYVGEGFVIGIKAKVRDAEAAGKALADAAAKGSEKAAKIESPSKVAMRDGKYFGEGWVNGILSYAKMSAEAGKSIAESALEGVKKSGDIIREAFDSNVDVNPTIRPVLDLSDIRNGAGQIGDILNLNPTPAFAGNLSAINGYVNTHRMNQNFDIGQAMNSLRATMNQQPSNTYIVNGLTYDDGSNVAAAVSRLIRAAKVERRV